ncbi:hypothetical protein RJ55_07417 [Drechmeria coniospora]|nr:hypothetical protein RJ55_07417 [Drechmeria coniospora]
MSLSSTDKSSSDFEFEPIEGVERIEKYRPGGYHPLQIGDTLHHRYRVINKLGHGTFSTTWLARDELEPNRSVSLVAIKITIADANTAELKALSALNSPPQHPSGHADSHFVPELIDRFSLQGPHGTHVCLVTVPGRASLARVKDASFRGFFQLDVARALAAQLILAVSYLHFRGFVHGDLHLGNVLLRLPRQMAEMSDEQIYSTFGEPRLEPVVRYDKKQLAPHVPSSGVLPIILGKPSEEITLPEASICLADYGEAHSPGSEARFESHAPLTLQPPESWFEPEEPLSFASDIWTLACAVWDILGHRSLFDGCLATADDITCEQVEILGMLPTEWWARWEARSKWFTSTGVPKGNIQTLDDRFESSLQEPREHRELPTFDADERRAILALMRSMLVFPPQKRANIGQVVNSEWMQKWALPEWNKLQLTSAASPV